jgi:hypothetical protein
MNCEDFEEYIALSAGGDLPHDDEKRLKSHLSVCSRCRNFAAGMAESQGSLVRWRSEAPDNELMAEVRSNVRVAIAQVPCRRYLLMASWSRRFGFAAGLALTLLAIAALWLAGSRPVGETIPAAGKRPEQAPDRKISEPAPAESRAVAVSEPKTRPAGPALGDSVRRAKIERRQPAPEPLRLELHTADPNIRIIWFIPPRQPGKTVAVPLGG